MVYVLVLSVNLVLLLLMFLISSVFERVCLIGFVGKCMLFGKLRMVRVLIVFIGTINFFRLVMYISLWL